MVDVFSTAKRREIMTRIKGKNTTPELYVRRLLHALGYRFRLHRGDLYGSPDIVLPRHRKVVFVHGCFWHGHRRCNRASLPHTNRTFWRDKIEGNRSRDQRVKRQLRRLGWKVLEIWQCQLRNPVALKRRVLMFLRQ